MEMMPCEVLLIPSIDVKWWLNIEDGILWFKVNG